MPGRPSLLCPVSVSGGKLRGSMGKLPELPVAFLLGMCLLADGDDVHSGLWGCLCKNHTGAPVHGLLHPRRFGKTRLFFLPLTSPLLPQQILPDPYQLTVEMLETVLRL